MNIWQLCWEAFIDLVHAAFPRPNYDVPISEAPMNKPPEPQIAPVAHVNAPDQLCTVAKSWLGKDASPLNRAPKELSCAEGVVNIINQTWPGTLDKTIIGTDVLFQALRRSPRFKGTLDPVAGCVEISPRTVTVNGHVGIYVAPDSIASNESRTGLFKINYTRQGWRDAFIKGRGLKAYIFVPVEISPTS